MSGFHLPRALGRLLRSQMTQAYLPPATTLPRALARTPHSRACVAATMLEIIGSKIFGRPAPNPLLYLEEFVRDRLIAEGFNANLTRHTRDGGADIVVRDELGEIVYLVQCKHTTKIDVPIDAGLLEDARRVRDNWRASGAVVIGVTNARTFSPRVTNEFKKINGRLIARDDLFQLRFSD